MAEQKDEPSWQKTDACTHADGRTDGRPALKHKVVITGKYSTLGLWKSYSYGCIQLICKSAPAREGLLD